MPVILKTRGELRAFTAATRREGRRIALVPTMGALHQGHMELVRQALARAEVCIVSIFVNPTQFGPNEDFAAYPRTWEADLAALTPAGAQAVYHPPAGEMYPEGFATKISVAGVSSGLCGAVRPGHFDGVATVVAKLLLQALPDVALFGEKDWQQLQVIRHMKADLDIPVDIIGVPTLRDENGLALSSRNAYLSPEQYKIAARLNKILFATAEKLKTGDIAAAESWARQEVLAAGFDSADYIEVRDAATLGPPGHGPLRILAAVRLGRARLIDNIAADAILVT